MKRGILVLLFILLSVCSVNAMTVELVSPSDGLAYQDVNSKDVKCKVTKNDTEELTNLNVWFGNNESTTWQAGPSPQSNPTNGAEYTFSLTNLVNATYTWNCLAVNNESNEQFAESDRTFIITFTTAASPANPPPSCTVSDTNITVLEDSGSWTLDSHMTSEAANISCSDTDTLTYSIGSQTGSGGTFSISSTDVLNFATDANATGTKIAVISVSDGTNTVQVSAQVIVSPVNDAPYLKEPIINKTWNEDATSKIDLDEYFADIDDSSLNYSYSFTSSSPFSISVNIEEDGDAVFTPENDWTGSETIIFTAQDSANASVNSNEAVLTVQEANQTSVNHPPSIDTYSPEASTTVSIGESQTFSITKSDPDDDAINVTWYVDNIVQEGKTGDSFTYTASTVGPFVVKVTVTDGQASDTNTWALTVQSAQVGTNKTMPPPSEGGLEENVTACGNGECSGDEDQLSCCKDCGCPEEYTCNADTGKCTKERKAGNITLLAVILGLFVGGASVGLYLYRKKQEKEIFGLANVPFEPPPKTGEAKKEEVSKKPQEYVIKKVEKAEEKPLKETKTTSQVLLKNYITTNMKKGKSLEQIKEELRKVGWTEEQVNDAYTAAQLEEAFS